MTSWCHEEPNINLSQYYYIIDNGIESRIFYQKNKFRKSQLFWNQHLSNFLLLETPIFYICVKNRPILWKSMTTVAKITPNWGRLNSTSYSTLLACTCKHICMCMFALKHSFMPRLDHIFYRHEIISFFSTKLVT